MMTNKQALAAQLAELEATLSTVRRDLSSDAGVLETSDLSEIRLALVATLNKHAATIAGAELAIAHP